MANSETAQIQERRGSVSQASETSQTAAEFISSQLQLEAEAREILPYQFDTCTYNHGPLRQSVFSCLTCNPPPDDASAPHASAGVCYACSISCHGEHELVELFTRRNFVCDCGTKRLPSTSTCSLRANVATGSKGDVHSEEPSATNDYNHNFRNHFCGCGELYNPHDEKGTMFQCLGLGRVEHGGCGEDWWHPECITGLPRDWHAKSQGEGREAVGTVGSDNNEAVEVANATSSAPLASIPEDAEPEAQTNGDAGPEDPQESDPPVPPGFPEEDDFDHFLCYKCVDAFPWIKRYAGTSGFLPAVYFSHDTEHAQSGSEEQAASVKSIQSEMPQECAITPSLKRKAEDETPEEPSLKKPRSEDSLPAAAVGGPKHASLPPTPIQRLSLFLREDFRDHLCRCRECFPLLVPHPQLLEEEVVYEPPVSDPGSENGAEGSIGSRSLFDRGEAALSNMDRVRAIEGVMAYNKLRDNLKGFLKPFAESGTPVGAEDIKKHFEKLRGDDGAMREAAQKAGSNGDGGGKGDQRREQGGY